MVLVYVPCSLSKATEFNISAGPTMVTVRSIKGDFYSHFQSESLRSYEKQMRYLGVGNFPKLDHQRIFIPRNGFAVISGEEKSSYTLDATNFN